MNGRASIAAQSGGMGQTPDAISRRRSRTCLLVFIASFVAIFVSTSLRPGMYDEGLILTGGMRVAAGQIPHRDFYANYGPAQFYILAGLFRLFGESILIERLWDVVVKAALVAFVYFALSPYCRRTVALASSTITAVWLVGLGMYGSPTVPVSLLNLLGAMLVLGVLSGDDARTDIFAAGAIAGLATLFRYDTGVTLLLLQLCLISVGVWLRSKDTRPRIRSWSLSLAFCLFGFSAVILPPLLYYQSVASIQPFIHDIILYPRTHYAQGRHLPFPGIHLKHLDNLGIYLPLAIVGLSLYAVFLGWFGPDPGGSPKSAQSIDRLKIRNFLIVFSVLSLLMYLKGVVRVSPGQMYLAIVPSLLLLAVLFEHRRSVPRPAEMLIVCLALLSVLAAASSAARAARELQVQHTSLPEYVLSSMRRVSTNIQTTWCAQRNALTKGLCFLPEEDRLRAIEFVVDHTTPQDRLFVGLNHNDRIFANDNLTYFATQRIPATKWSHFDPGLQNTYPIQAEIIGELDRNSPPYIVEDAEFESSTTEPNDSAKSSGVMLLDDFIDARYREIETYGTMSIWKRE